MSRRYKKKDWTEEKWGTGVVVVMLIFMFVCYSISATTYQFPLKQPTTNLDDTFDTLIVKSYVGTVLRDSVLFTSFPVDDSLTLSTDTSYEVVSQFSYVNIDGLTSPGIIYLAAQSVTTFTNAIHPFRIYATVGTDTISGVFLEFSNATGTEGGNGITNSSGFVDKTVPDGTIQVEASHAGFTFNDTSYSVTADDTVAIVGTAFTPGTPAGASVCRIWGWVSNLSRVGVKEAIVTATISPDAFNLCDSTIPLVTIASATTSSHADSLGYFQHNFKVYDRQGQACDGCNCDVSKTGGIARIVQAGRSTFFCAKKQK